MRTPVQMDGIAVLLLGSGRDSLDGVVAGEGDQASKSQREGIEHLGARVQPG